MSNKRLDPRWLVLSSLTLLTLYLISNPTFGKGPQQMLLAFGTAALADFTIRCVLGGKKYRFPLSALTSATGVCVIVFSPYYWPFVVLPLLAVASKRLIRYNGLHVFNPNNFAVVCGLLLFTPYMSSTAGKWQHSYIVLALTIGMGILITHLVRRLPMSLTWLSGFVVLALIRNFGQGMSVAQIFLPMTDPLFYIFTFYHITDPVTTPANRRGQIVFGAGIALIDGLIRWADVDLSGYSLFFALFIMTAIQPVFENIFQRDYEREHWVPQWR
jgi:Na+-translocating ferredoxin:NAD+ oxidoreductase RnfD subunit